MLSNVDRANVLATRQTRSLLTTQISVVYELVHITTANVAYVRCDACNELAPLGLH